MMQVEIYNGRKILMICNLFILFRKQSKISYKNNKLENVLSEQDIKEILKENDIIVPNYTFIIKHNAEKSWEKTHIKKDYDECKKIISEKYPDYIEAFEKFSKSI